MRMMTRSLGLLLLLSLPAVAQEAKPLELSLVPQQGQAPTDFVPPGWKAEATLKGDLDKNGSEDVVLQLIGEGPETTADGAPTERTRALVVLLSEGGKFRRAGASNKVLLCTVCSGMMGGAEGARASIQKGVILVDQYSGSREYTQTLLRFRYEPKDKRVALIGEDVTRGDRATGKGEKTSTNLLTGQRITEKLQYDAKKEKDVVVSSKKDKVPIKRTWLEDVNIENY